MGVILICAGFYYYLSFFGDYNYAVRQHLHYNYEGMRLRGGLSKTVHRFDESVRAFNGIEARFWSSVEDDKLADEFKRHDASLEEYWAEVAQSPMDQVVKFQPRRFEIFADCLHFSVITMTTVGYGDITPRVWQAKLAADTQALSGVLLFVVALGMLFGNWWERSDEVSEGIGSASIKPEQLARDESNGKSLSGSG